MVARLVNHWLRVRGKTTESEHMQDIAYYENGQERMVGDETATAYYANRKESNSWARALGIDVEKLARKKTSSNDEKK